jgi:hypothetical protein
VAQSPFAGYLRDLIADRQTFQVVKRRRGWTSDEAVNCRAPRISSETTKRNCSISTATRSVPADCVP